MVFGMPEGANKPEEGRYRDLRAAGFRPLKTYINADTALAYEFVEHRYHVPSELLVLLAPLFFTLLAEGSLAWRRQKLAEVKEALDHLESAPGAAAHLSFAYAGASRREEGEAEEEASIEQSDLFGRGIRRSVDFGYDHSKNNPFADYLRQLAAGIDPSVVELDAEGNALSLLIPKHRIGQADLKRITGGDFWATFALERGHARIRDIPKELQGDSASEKRIAWLTERIPQTAREEFEALNRSLDKDKNMGPTNA